MTDDDVKLPEPVAWTLRSELEARQTTYRAHLWFSDPQNSQWAPIYDEPTVRRLIAEAVEREREACAVLCEVLPTPADYMTANRSHWECGTIDCADAIRNRSKA